MCPTCFTNNHHAIRETSPEVQVGLYQIPLVSQTTVKEGIDKEGRSQAEMLFQWVGVSRQSRF